jgi:hypothetical protein
MTSETAQAKPSGFPLCPRCGSEMTWGGSRTKASNLGCLMGLLVTLTKAAWMNLLRKPRCESCGKVSKFEVISHEGRVPGVFWLWITAALLGGTLVVSAFVAFFMSTARPR